MTINHTKDSTRYPDLRGKTAVVTGSSSGIGEAIARHMGSEAMNVVINYINADEKVIDGLIYLIEQSGGRAVGIRADVGTEAGVQAISTFGLTMPVSRFNQKRTKHHMKTGNVCFTLTWMVFSWELRLPYNTS